MVKDITNEDFWIVSFSGSFRSSCPAVSTPFVASESAFFSVFSISTLRSLHRVIEKRKKLNENVLKSYTTFLYKYVFTFLGVLLLLCILLCADDDKRHVVRIDKNQDMYESARKYCEDLNKKYTTSISDLKLKLLTVS